MIALIWVLGYLYCGICTFCACVSLDDLSDEQIHRFGPAMLCMVVGLWPVFVALKLYCVCRRLIRGGHK